MLLVVVKDKGEPAVLQKELAVHEKPVVFEFSSFTSSSFVAKNEANEFPQKIIYIFDGKNIEAKVSAEELEVPFYFEPLKK